MKESVSTGNHVTPMLFPYQPEQFWQSIRAIVQEEVRNAVKPTPTSPLLKRLG